MADWKKVIEFMSTQGLPQVNEEEQIIMKYVLGTNKLYTYGVLIIKRQFKYWLCIKNQV